MVLVPSRKEENACFCGVTHRRTFTLYSGDEWSVMPLLLNSHTSASPLSLSQARVPKCPASSRTLNYLEPERKEMERPRSPTRAERAEKRWKMDRALPWHDPEKIKKKKKRRSIIWVILAWLVQDFKMVTWLNSFPLLSSSSSSSLFILRKKGFRAVRFWLPT